MIFMEIIYYIYYILYILYIVYIIYYIYYILYIVCVIYYTYYYEKGIFDETKERKKEEDQSQRKNIYGVLAASCSWRLAGD